MVRHVAFEGILDPEAIRDPGRPEDVVEGSR